MCPVYLSSSVSSRTSYLSPLGPSPSSLYEKSEPRAGKRVESLASVLLVHLFLRGCLATLASRDQGLQLLELEGSWCCTTGSLCPPHLPSCLETFKMIPEIYLDGQWAVSHGLGSRLNKKKKDVPLSASWPQRQRDPVTSHPSYQDFSNNDKPHP